MSKSLVKRSNGILAGQEPANPVGKAMVLSGGGALAIALLAALIPFVGVIGLAAVIFLVGLVVI